MWMKVIVLAGLYLNYVQSQLTYDVVQNILKENNSTNGCKKQYGTLISNDTFSLFKMFDASSFTGLQHGVLEGKFFDFGAYDECLAVNTIDEKIFGKYCLATIPFSELPNLIPKYDIPADLSSLPNTLMRHTQLLTGSKSNRSMVGLHFGTCIPNDCSASQVEEYVNAVLPVPVYYVEDYCYDRRTNTVFTGAAIGGIIVLAVILVVSIVSTVFDLWISHKEAKTRYEALRVFSVYTHGKNLFTFTTSEDQLPCLNGIKALAMIRVIMVHEYGAHLANAAGEENMLLYINEVFTTRATIAVDLFFAISGALLVYTMLKPVPFRIGDVVMFYLRRYLRLTPAFAIVILVLGTGLSTYVGSGPLWYATNSSHSFCKEYWWSALLYIQNYVNLDGMCLGPSWYLSVDMQIIFLSPLILIPLKAHREKTLFGLFFLALLGAVSPFINACVNNYGATPFNRNSESYRNNFYDQTHARFGPFVVGMIAGYYIHQIKGGQKLEIRPIKSSIVLIICLAVLYGCAYVGPVVPNVPLSNALYHSLHRMIGAIAVMVIVILCVSGNAAPVNWFLTVNIFQFLGKLSYSMYLVHYPVIEARKLSIRTTSYYSRLDWISNFMGTVFLTICLSIVLHLVVECPVIALQKRFLKPSKPKTKPGDKV